MTRMPNEPCPFCDVSQSTRLRVAETERSVAFTDNYPVSAGHTLLTPKRHAGSLFELSDEEALDLFRLLVRVRSILQEQFKPDGFNIGVNEGKAAGQTVRHVHVHMIPRYIGDVDRPAGGIRNIIPNRVRYP